MARLRSKVAEARYLIAAASLTGWPALAVPPGEVTGDRFTNATTLAWNAVAGADDYNVYRGLLSSLRSGIPAQCHGDEITAASFTTPALPPSGEAYFYLVTAESNAGGEGTAGNSSGNVPRALRGSCDKVMRNHLLDRVGYGGDEWSRGRLAAIGRQAYINEQLNPASIDESTNTELNNRITSYVGPTVDTLPELQALDVIQAVYARRQLEQQVTMFWVNHFNTEWRKSNQYFGFYQNCQANSCATSPNCCTTTQNTETTRLHYLDLQSFRNLAFNGNFRQTVEASGLGPAMILFLDTNVNVSSAPNENYARELLELHTMGVDGGYTQQDIVELARVFTGFNICKKFPADTSLLGACIPQNQLGVPTEPAGVWAPNFRPQQHDNGQKILFQGTPYQRIIPATTPGSSGAYVDAGLAYDGIVAHPATAAYISKKLLQRFVTENPTQAMINAVVAEWNDAGNPHGVGDLREVLRAVLAQAEFLNPDQVHGKIKTPYEQIASALRAIRGKTDGSSGVRTYMSQMQEVLHMNAVPTGYSELGGDWLDTNNLLARQNWGLDLASRTATTYGNDLIPLLQANGISTSPTPNNAPAIVDFLADILFGGALTPAERQAAINYLNTDDNGNSSNYNDTRIRETAGFMMGYAQFLEQ